MGDKIPKVVRAEQFELVDKNGKRQANLGVEGGGAILTLHGPDGEIGIGLSMVNGEATVAMMDLVTRTVIRLCLQKDGPVVALVGPGGKGRALLGVTKKDGPALSMVRPDGGGLPRVPRWAH